MSYIQTKTHIKRRGIIHCCDWCGAPIEVGERYIRWSRCEDGSPVTVRVHEECFDAWTRETER